MSLASPFVIVLESAERERLEHLAASRTAPCGQVRRATALLAAADGLSNAAIARKLHRHVDTIRAWRKRFTAEDMATLTDRPRPLGRPRFAPEDRLRIIAAATSVPPGADTAWSHRLLAKHLSEVGISAALNVHTGQVLTETITRNDSATFIRFLRLLDSTISADQELHLIMDNGSSHNSKKTRAWLAAHPRFHVHHTPKHASWLNQVEIFFSTLARRMLRRGQFASREELADRIDEFVLRYDETDAKPYRWTYDGTRSRPPEPPKDQCGAALVP